jgi:hypothetical protein
MLYLPTTAEKASAAARRPTLRTVFTVLTGQSLAKKRRGPRARARLAAKWVLGWLTLEPTIRLAARMFGVSEPLVRAAVAEFVANAGPDPAPAADLARIWTLATAEERATFVRANLLQVWDTLEAVTA